MEKLIYALWAPEGESRAAFGARILSDLPRALKREGASGIRLNVRDGAVDPAAALLQQWQSPQQDAVVQFWLPSANAIFRSGVDAVIERCSSRFAAWLVAESTIIPNRDHVPCPGQRTWGWSQASFITFRSDRTQAAAVDHWHGHHTRVAIETQSNFEYVQNIVVRPLTADAPAYSAFVEECFPAEAMSEPRAFFDAQADEALFARNTQAMADSCAGFIDFARIDIIPTSQFDFADLDD